MKSLDVLQQEQWDVAAATAAATAAVTAATLAHTTTTTAGGTRTATTPLSLGIGAGTAPPVAVANRLHAASAAPSAASSLLPVSWPATPNAAAAAATYSSADGDRATVQADPVIASTALAHLLLGSVDESAVSHASSVSLGAAAAEKQQPNSPGLFQGAQEAAAAAGGSIRVEGIGGLGDAETLLSDISMRSSPRSLDAILAAGGDDDGGGGDNGPSAAPATSNADLAPLQRQPLAESRPWVVSSDSLGDDMNSPSSVGGYYGIPASAGAGAGAGIGVATLSSSPGAIGAGSTRATAQEDVLRELKAAQAAFRVTQEFISRGK